MKTTSIYTLHPGLTRVDTALANLKERTGKTLEEWTRIVKKSGLSSAKENAAWLKEHHAFTTNYAKFVAESAAGENEYDPDALVETMFEQKAELRPIYDRLLAMGMKLGKDVTVTPCATIVPLRRKFVFAQIKPSTKTRIDLGFALGKTKAPRGTRLVDTGGLAKGDRITHKIALSAVAEIDAEVQRWFKAAYDLDA